MTTARDISVIKRNGPDAQRFIRLDIPLLLPDVDSERDACIQRLTTLLEHRDGVSRVHVALGGEKEESLDVEADSNDSAEVLRAFDGASDSRRTRTAAQPQLCLHYDPERLSLSQVLAIAKAAGAEVSDRYAHAVIPFHLIGSEDDGTRLEKGLECLPGVFSATVSLPAQVARIEYDRERSNLGAIESGLRELGAQPLGTSLPSRDILPRQTSLAKVPPAKPFADPEHSDEDTEPSPSGGWYARNRELAWSLFAGAALAAGWALQRQDVATWIPIAAFVVAYVFGARDNISHFVGDLRRGHFHFNIDLLMVVAAIGAAILGEWFEGGLLLFLFSLGHALEHYALGRARNAIKALADIAPQIAVVVRDGRELEVPIAEVSVGDKVVVKPAERIPVDGTITEGRSAVNQAPITGESVPVDKAAGDQVFAGSVNGEGALVIDVAVAIGDRTLDRVIRLVAEAQTQKAPTQQFTDRFEKIFVPLVLVGDLALIVFPPLVGVWTWSESFYRAMAMLVAASPCALALGTPAAVLAGIAQAARNGVLIKGGAYLETLGTIRVLALDKTGTITKGEPEVTDVVPLNGTTEEELLSTAAAAERRSQHPLAKAVLRAAEGRSLSIPEAGDVESVTGRGIRSVVDGQRVVIGRLLMFEEASASIPEPVREAVQRLEQAGRSTVVVHRGGSPGSGMWLGILGIADEPRTNVRETLNSLREAGITKIVMLTGDNAGVGNAVGKAVGIDEVRAGLLPEDKVAAIKELAASGSVAMVGDGVNDAPALAHATVGIAMGGAGTAAALETADLALMGDDLAKLPFAVGLSRRARGVIRQNLYVSLAVIAILVLATVSGVIRIGPAVIIHEGSTLVVIANALRLLAYRGKASMPAANSASPMLTDTVPAVA